MKNNASRPTPELNELPILETKIGIRSISGSTLVRQRLIEKLNECANGRLTLLSAPAGFGKSTLLQHWACQAPSTPAWFSVESSDNEVYRFWRYIVMSINGVRPGFYHKVAGMLNLIYSSDYELALTMLQNEFQQLSGSLWLVIDDFHHITDEKLLASFRFVVEHLPPHVHILLASRTEIPLPVSKWIESEVLTGLGIEDLRFTVPEGSSFYSTCMKLHLPESEIDAWVQQTEGWVTAMKLAALFLRQSPSNSAASGRIPQSLHQIERYLLEEVFEALDADTRQFLLNCSFLERMTAPLCEAITGNSNSRQMLEKLDREQLFLVPLDETYTWFRFHHLFKSFLQKRLLYTQPSDLPAIYLAAGQWCMSEEWKDEALEYWISGEYFDLAIQLLYNMSAKSFSSDACWLNDKFSKIPEAILLEHPVLYFSYVFSLIVGVNDHTGGERLLRIAERAIREKAEVWPEEQRNDFLGMFYFIKMLHAMVVRKDLEESIRFLRHSQSFGKYGHRIIFAKSKQSGLPSLIKEHARIGNGRDNHTYLMIFQDLIAMYEDTESAPVLMECLAEWQYEQNNLEEAKKNAVMAIRHAEMGGLALIKNVVLLPAYTTLARIQKAQGQQDEAEQTLLELRQHIIELGVAKMLMFCDGERAWMDLETGNANTAKAWLHTYRLKDTDPFTFEQWYEYMYLAKIQLALGQLESTWTIINRILPIAIEENRFYFRLEAEWIRVLLLHAAGETKQALENLGRVLHEVEPYGVSRTLIEWGRPMNDIVTCLKLATETKRSRNSPSLGYLRAILAEFGRTELRNHQVGAPLDQLLTKKEMDVFLLLTDRLTNRQIADRLGIGYGTVRTHLNNIYSKLYVRNREEAIGKGDELLR